MWCYCWFNTYLVSVFVPLASPMFSVFDENPIASGLNNMGYFRKLHFTNEQCYGQSALQYRCVPSWRGLFHISVLCHAWAQYCLRLHLLEPQAQLSLVPKREATALHWALSISTSHDATAQYWASSKQSKQNKHCSKRERERERSQSVWLSLLRHSSLHRATQLAFV